jgi:hypothetical protein
VDAQPRHQSLPQQGQFLLVESQSLRWLHRSGPSIISVPGTRWPAAATSTTWKRASAPCGAGSGWNGPPREPDQRSMG